MHFVQKAELGPFLVGAADMSLLKACGELALPAAAIDPELDVWTYKRKERVASEVCLRPAAPTAYARLHPLPTPGCIPWSTRAASIPC